jgi:hypothetical protein
MVLIADSNLVITFGWNDVPRPLETCGAGCRIGAVKRPIERPVKRS